MTGYLSYKRVELVNMEDDLGKEYSRDCFAAGNQSLYVLDPDSFQARFQLNIEFAVLEMAKNNEYTFKLTKNGVQYVFTANSEDDLVKWYAALVHCVIQKDDIKEHYLISKTLGKGSFA